MANSGHILIQMYAKYILYNIPYSVQDELAKGLFCIDYYRLELHIYSLVGLRFTVQLLPQDGSR